MEVVEDHILNPKLQLVQMVVLVVGAEPDLTKLVDQVIHLLQLQLKDKMVVQLIVVMDIDQEVEVEQSLLVYPLLMETVEDKVVVVLEYQQLLALMVFLVEVLDITLEVVAEVVTVEVDYLEQ